MYKDNKKNNGPKKGCWKRIEAVIKMAGMTTNGFALHIGLCRGENLYQIKRGNNGVSFDVADRIATKFPQVSKLWLMTGEGQMINGDAATRPWSNMRTPNSEAFRGYAAALILPVLVNKDGCHDPYALAVNHAEKLQAALAQKGGQQ